MDDLTYEIEVKQEVFDAGKEHGFCFHSPHEGIAVLYEEFEEFEENVKLIKESIKDMWCDITDDLVIDEYKFKKAKNVAKYAHNELIQVAAMIEKLEAYYKK